MMRIESPAGRPFVVAPHAAMQSTPRSAIVYGHTVAPPSPSPRFQNRPPLPNQASGNSVLLTNQLPNGGLRSPVALPRKIVGGPLTLPINLAGSVRRVSPRPESSTGSANLSTGTDSNDWDQRQVSCGTATTAATPPMAAQVKTVEQHQQAREVIRLSSGNTHCSGSNASVAPSSMCPTIRQRSAPGRAAAPEPLTEIKTLEPALATKEILSLATPNRRRNGRDGSAPTQRLPWRRDQSRDVGGAQVAETLCEDQASLSSKLPRFATSRERAVELVPKVVSQMQGDQCGGSQRRASSATAATTAGTTTLNTSLNGTATNFDSIMPSAITTPQQTTRKVSILSTGEDNGLRMHKDAAVSSAIVKVVESEVSNGFYSVPSYIASSVDAALSTNREERREPQEQFDVWEEWVPTQVKKSSKSPTRCRSLSEGRRVAAAAAAAAAAAWATGAPRPKSMPRGSGAAVRRQLSAASDDEAPRRLRRCTQPTQNSATVAKAVLRSRQSSAGRNRRTTLPTLSGSPDSKPVSPIPGSWKRFPDSVKVPTDVVSPRARSGSPRRQRRCSNANSEIVGLRDVQVVTAGTRPRRMSSRDAPALETHERALVQISCPAGLSSPEHRWPSPSDGIRLPCPPPLEDGLHQDGCRAHEISQDWRKALCYDKQAEDQKTVNFSPRQIYSPRDVVRDPPPHPLEDGIHVDGCRRHEISVEWRRSLCGQKWEEDRLLPKIIVERLNSPDPAWMTESQERMKTFEPLGPIHQVGDGWRTSLCEDKRLEDKLTEAFSPRRGLSPGGTVRSPPPRHLEDGIHKDGCRPHEIHSVFRRSLCEQKGINDKHIGAFYPRRISPRRSNDDLMLANEEDVENRLANSPSKVECQRATSSVRESAVVHRPSVGSQNVATLADGLKSPELSKALASASVPRLGLIAMPQPQRLISSSSRPQSPPLSARTITKEAPGVVVQVAAAPSAFHMQVTPRSPSATRSHGGRVSLRPGGSVSPVPSMRLPLQAIPRCLPIAMQAPISGGGLCATCGTTLVSTALFCHHCGTRQPITLSSTKSPSSNGSHATTVPGVLIWAGSSTGGTLTGSYRSSSLGTPR